MPVMTRDEAGHWAAEQRAAGRRVVFTNGVFDLLHPGHTRYLIEARAQSLLVQAEIIAVAIAASATVETNTLTIDVDKLLDLIAVLRQEGCNVIDKVDESEFGKFGWVVDPDGNKIELWEPPEGQ